MASVALARENLRRAPHDVFGVDRALFDHRRVSDVGREPIGEFRSNVSFLAWTRAVYNEVVNAERDGHH